VACASASASSGTAEASDTQEGSCQGDGAPLAALHLRRTDEQFPRAGWPSSNENLVIMSGETVVGALWKTVSATQRERWQWSITCITEASIGSADTREEAQAQFAEAWRTWLKRTGLQEVG
jgi:hypothetical protein